MKKSLVLLSGGLDSTVNFYQAISQSQVLLALTFDYGQRAAPREIATATKLCAGLGIPHQTLELSFFKGWGSSLTDSSLSVPKGDQVSIDDPQISQETARSVWVPNRNGIFLNIAAGFAEACGAHWVIPGFNKEEAVTFSDNSQDFIKAMTRAFHFSTRNAVEVHCFTTQMTKTQIVALGLERGTDFRLMWPCYFAGAQWCGECESCQRSRRALEANGLSWQELSHGGLE